MENHPKERPKFPIDRTVKDLVKRSDNTKVTFCQRLLYKERSPSVILSIADRAISKLKVLGIVEEGFNIEIDPGKLESLENEHEQRKSRYQGLGTAAYS